MRYKISPSMNRNVRLQSLGNEHAFRSTGLITNEAGTTNYTTTNALGVCSMVLKEKIYALIADGRAGLKIIEVTNP